MTVYTLKIKGMACSMCEAHINDAIRNRFPVKKIRSDHRKGETVFRCAEEVEESLLRKTIAETGYELVSVEKAEEKPSGGFLGWFRK